MERFFRRIAIIRIRIRAAAIHSRSFSMSMQLRRIRIEAIPAVRVPEYGSNTDPPTGVNKSINSDNNPTGLSEVLTGDLDFLFINLCLTNGTLSTAPLRRLEEQLIRLKLESKAGLKPSGCVPGDLAIIKKSVIT